MIASSFQFTPIIPQLLTDLVITSKVINSCCQGTFKFSPLPNVLWPIVWLHCSGELIFEWDNTFSYCLSPLTGSKGFGSFTTPASCWWQCWLEKENSSKALKNECGPKWYNELRNGEISFHNGNPKPKTGIKTELLRMLWWGRYTVQESGTCFIFLSHHNTQSLYWPSSDPPLWVAPFLGEVNEKNPHVGKYLPLMGLISSSIKWVGKRAPHCFSFGKISVNQTFLFQTQFYIDVILIYNIYSY